MHFRSALALLAASALVGAGGSDDPKLYPKSMGEIKAMTQVLAGKKNLNVESDAHGQEFKFFVGTVLTKGVSGTERAAFEVAMKAAPAGNFDPVAATALAAKYPGIANAYSPEQWKTLFQTRGLDAKTFGASWKPV